MSEKEDFWKELLGDEFEYLLNEDNQSDVPADNAAEPTESSHADEDADGAQPPTSNSDTAGGVNDASAVSDADFDMLQRLFGSNADHDGKRSADRENAQLHKPAPAEMPPAARKATDAEGQALPQARHSGGMISESGDQNKVNTPPKTKRTGFFGKKETLPEELVGSDNFEVDFDFESEYQDVNEKPVSRGRYKKMGCLSGVMLFLFVVCVSAVLATLLWMASTDVLALGKENSVVELTVPAEIFSQRVEETKKEDGTVETKTVKAADIDSVTDILYENGLIKYKKLFSLFAKFAHADTKISAGTYALNTNYDYRALVHGMTASGGKRVEINVTIPEGYTIDKMVELLAKNNVCTSDELWDVLANYDFDFEFVKYLEKGDRYRFEGYLFPDTYTFYVGDKPVNVVKKLLNNFSKKWTEDFAEQAERLGRTQREILTIASLIEKEAGGDQERGDISSVIYNRLGSDRFPYLQIDASIYYGISRNGGEFSTELDDPYNTYLYKGLPPGPIANPGLASIKAALHPNDTSYYFYALGKNGLHKFFKNYDSFTEFVNSDEYGG